MCHGTIGSSMIGIQSQPYRQLLWYPMRWVTIGAHGERWRGVAHRVTCTHSEVSTCRRDPAPHRFNTSCFVYKIVHFANDISHKGRPSAKDPTAQHLYLQSVRRPPHNLNTKSQHKNTGRKNIIALTVLYTLHCTLLVQQISKPSSLYFLSTLSLSDNGSNLCNLQQLHKTLIPNPATTPHSGYDYALHRTGPLPRRPHIPNCDDAPSSPTDWHRRHRPTPYTHMHRRTHLRLQLLPSNSNDKHHSHNCTHTHASHDTPHTIPEATTQNTHIKSYNTHTALSRNSYSTTNSCAITNHTQIVSPSSSQNVNFAPTTPEIAPMSSLLAPILHTSGAILVHALHTLSHHMETYSYIHHTLHSILTHM